MIDLKKRVDENEYQYLYRMGQLVDSGKVENWRSITPIINEQLRDDISEYRDESAYRKGYQAARTYWNNVFCYMLDDEFAEHIAKERRELQKERMKLQTEKIELNRWLRENSRDELYIEKVIDALSDLPEIQIPQRIISQSERQKEFVLCFGDPHYGVEFQILGLFGEVLNEYSPEIFEARMWQLLNDVVEIIKKEKIDVLNVFSLGDDIDGVLRVGQLMKLKYGVVESTVKYMEFLSNWLNELSKYVVVKFQMVHGNHSELRFFNQKNGAFKDENMGKITVAYIKERLSKNPNFIYIDNPTGLIFSEVAGFNILGIHGEVKNMEKALKDLSSIYGVQIDYLIGGHLHHGEYEDIGVKRGTVRIPSIMGTDEFAMSLRKSSDAGATMLCFENGVGKTIEYSIRLK